MLLFFNDLLLLSYDLLLVHYLGLHLRELLGLVEQGVTLKLLSMKLALMLPTLWLSRVLAIGVLALVQLRQPKALV